MHLPHPPSLRLALLAVLIAPAAALGTPITAGAYPSPGATATLHADCHAIFQRSNPDCRLHFRLLDAQGHPVSGAAVTWSVAGIAGATVEPLGPATGRNGQALAVLAPGAGTCERTATIRATAGGVSAQTQVEVECVSDRRGGGRHLPPPGVFGTILDSWLLGAGGARLTGNGGGLSLTVPAGALPAGTQVSVVGADPAQLHAYLPPGSVLVDSFAVEWTGTATASAPISLAVHNAADHPGLRVFEVTSTGLQPVPGASVTDGVATVSVTEDPGFVVLAPATAGAGAVRGLGSAAATAVAAGSDPRGLGIEVGGAMLALCLAAWARLRRRRRSCAF